MAEPLRRDERLLDDPWLAQLPDACRRALLGGLGRRVFAAGEPVFLQGEAATHFCCLLQGELEVSTVSVAGREHVLTHLFAVRWFAEMSFLDDAPRSHSVIAARRSVVAMLPRARLTALMERHPPLVRAMARILCENMRMLFLRVDEFQKRSIDVLVANTLLHHWRVAPGGAVEISQARLAAVIGASRQSVNACLARWEAEGVIARAYRRILLLDPAALDRIAATER